MSKVIQTLFGFALVGLEVFLHLKGVVLPEWFHAGLLVFAGYFISQSVMKDFLTSVSELMTKLLPWKKNGG